MLNSEHDWWDLWGQVGEVANEFDRVAYGKRCST